MLWYNRGFVCTPSPIAQLLGVLERVRMDGVLLLKNPVLAGPSIVLWPDFSPRRLSMGDSRQEGSPLTGSGHDLSPPLGVVETMGVAPEGAQLIASGLSTEVAETILQSRAPSIRKLYALKLRLRVRRPPAWSSSLPAGTVLEFSQARFSAELAHSTLKVYVAAIAPTTPLLVAFQ